MPGRRAGCTGKGRVGRHRRRTKPQQEHGTGPVGAGRLAEPSFVRAGSGVCTGHELGPLERGLVQWASGMGVGRGCQVRRGRKRWNRRQARPQEAGACAGSGRYTRVRVWLAGGLGLGWAGRGSARDGRDFSSVHGVLRMAVEGEAGDGVSWGAGV